MPTWSRGAPDARQAARLRCDRARGAPAGQGQPGPHVLGHELGRRDPPRSRPRHRFDPAPHPPVQLALVGLARVPAPIRPAARLRARRRAGGRAPLRRGTRPLLRGAARRPDEHRVAAADRLPPGEARAVPRRAGHVREHPRGRPARREHPRGRRPGTDVRSDRPADAGPAGDPPQAPRPAAPLLPLTGPPRPRPHPARGSVPPRDPAGRPGAAAPVASARRPGGTHASRHPAEELREQLRPMLTELFENARTSSTVEAITRSSYAGSGDWPAAKLRRSLPLRLLDRLFRRDDHQETADAPSPSRFSPSRAPRTPRRSCGGCASSWPVPPYTSWPGCAPSWAACACAAATRSAERPSISGLWIQQHLRGAGASHAERRRLLGA